jgi:hypothetical protein
MLLCNGVPLTVIHTVYPALVNSMYPTLIHKMVDHSMTADGFIEDPAAAFPAGMRVDARVAALEAGGRVELTLR